MSAQPAALQYSVLDTAAEPAIILYTLLRTLFARPNCQMALGDWCACTAKSSISSLKYWRMVVAEMLEKEALQIEFQFEVCIHMAEACKS